MLCACSEERGAFSPDPSGRALLLGGDLVLLLALLPTDLCLGGMLNSMDTVLHDTKKYIRLQMFSHN